MEKIKTLLWFLQRPHLYPQLIYQLRQKFNPHRLEATRHESIEWCKAVGMTSNEAITKITSNHTISDVEKLHQNDFHRGEDIVKQIPVEMGGAGDCNLLYHLTVFLKPTHVIETGVAYGWSSMSILLAMEVNGLGHLTSSDMPYAKLNNEDYVGCIIPDRLNPRWTLKRNADRQVLPNVLSKLDSLELAHYDSDKSYRGRMWAYPRLWKKLSKNGILVSDDIDDNLAFKHFSESVQQTPTVVNFRGKSIGLLVKG